MSSSEGPSATELLTRYIEFIDSDRSAWRALLDDNAVLEFPNASSLGAARRHEGIAAIDGHVHAVLSQLDDAVFKNVAVHALEEANRAVGEFEIEATVRSTGRKYRQRYVLFLTAAAGKAVFVREYWDPVEIIRAFNLGTIELNAALIA